MRKLERKTAIRLTLKMWRWLAKTGRNKRDYLEEVERRDIWPADHCFLCEYAQQQTGTNVDYCYVCPYYRQYGRCLVHGSPSEDEPYSMWANATSDAERMEWAEKCVEQLEALI